MATATYRLHTGDGNAYQGIVVVSSSEQRDMAMLRVSPPHQLSSELINSFGREVGVRTIETAETRNAKIYELEALRRTYINSDQEQLTPDHRILRTTANILKYLVSIDDEKLFVEPYLVSNQFDGVYDAQTDTFTEGVAYSPAQTRAVI